MKHVATLLALPVLLICQTALPAQGEKEAIKAFKKDFKPKAKSLQKPMDGLEKYSPESAIYKGGLEERSKIAARWRKAAEGLKGHGSQEVAKLVAGAWVKVDKQVAPLWKKRAKLEKRIDREWEQILKMTNGKGVWSNRRYPVSVINAYNGWAKLSGEAGRLRLDITDLTSLQETLRNVVAAMKETAGLTWMLRSVVGSSKHSLAFKVEAIRSAGRMGQPRLEEMTGALDRARKYDEIAALVFGIAIQGETAKSSAPKLIELLQHVDEGVREQAALALQHMKVGGAIKPMIDLLAREQGHSKKRIAAALEVLTGKQLGVNMTAWQNWYAAEGADYAAGKRPLGQGKPSHHGEFNKKNYYYGIPQDGKSIVYIIDCSGSMVVDKDNPRWGDPEQLRDPIHASNKKNSRSEASKRELNKALGALNANQKFNIIWYNHAATLYKKKMVEATPELVRLAQEWVRGLPAQSSTNIYDAMKMAFTLVGRGSYDKHYSVEFDTIFLLTDGKPTLAGVGDDDPMKIIEGVREWNALKRVVIHTIAMGQQGIDHKFMQMLATENGGEYRKVLKGGKVEKGGAKAGK